VTRFDITALAAAAASYERYVRTKADAFVDATEAFTTAVRAGDRPRAQRLYPTARTYFERIETVVESFGDLDPRIDARDGDLDPGTQWTGYHRLEKDLWSSADLKADAAIANTLLADVTALRDRLATTALRPLELANGANGACSTRSPLRRSPGRRTATPTPTCGTSRPTSRALTREQVRTLANAIDALAEPVSTVAAVVATR